MIARLRTAFEHGDRAAEIVAAALGSTLVAIVLFVFLVVA